MARLCADEDAAMLDAHRDDRTCHGHRFQRELSSEIFAPAAKPDEKVNFMQLAECRRSRARWKSFENTQ
jgi:hypothetical protein